MGNDQDNAEETSSAEYKIHISRVPTKFSEDTVKRILKEQLVQKLEGGDALEVSVELVFPRPEGSDKKEDEVQEDRDENDKSDPTSKEHRGFGFVTFDSEEAYKTALELKTIRGGRKPTSRKQHTLYLRPYAETEEEMNVCYLWSQRRCPYGDECKFSHTGPGACLEQPSGDTDDAAKKKKKGKCFAFKKGKCDKGDDCPFSHDFAPAVKNSAKQDIPKSEKDCISWKTKGKCRKGDDCPYRHDPEALKRLEKKKQKKEQHDKPQKERQPLSVRVFGMSYETTEQDIRDFLQDCGKIQDVTFPTFEDSGRSKGYCGVWFSSPNAVAKAVELDGEELHGRWLRIQAGKMYLKQWENLHPPSKRQKTQSWGETE